MGRFRSEIPELAAVLDGADHVDVKSVESEMGLREFVAAALSFRPWWVTALFGVRSVFAWLLRLQQAGPPTAARRRLRREQIPFRVGAAVSFFTVTAAQEDRFLLMSASDTHLTGYLAFVVVPADPASGSVRRCDVVTVVRYHQWTGPLYFFVVRPFHHLVVGGMVKAGARGVGQAQNRNNPEPTAARNSLPPARSSNR